MKRTPPCPGHSATAFSLIEMLGVIAIVALLAALIVPAVKGISGGNALTQSAGIVVGELDLARRLALTESQQTEIRLFKIPQDSEPRSEYRALQIFRVRDGFPVDTLKRLPQGVILSEDPRFSTLLSSSNPNGGTANLPGFGEVPYKAVCFGSSGGTTLDPRGSEQGADRWFVTLKAANAPSTADRPATNFITVEIDPVTGRTKYYQP